MSMSIIAPYGKAVTAALVAGLSVLSASAATGGIGWADVIASLIAFLVASIAVWRVPNRRRRPTEGS